MVSLGAAALALPTCATTEFLLRRALRVSLPTGQGRVVHLFVIYGYQVAEEDAEKLQLTGNLLQAVLAEAGVVCTGQPVLIAGDLNAYPAVIPCLAKGILLVSLLILLLLTPWRREGSGMLLASSGWRIALVLSCLRGGGRGKFSAGRRCTGARCRFTSREATRHWYQVSQGRCSHTFPPPGGS